MGNAFRHRANGRRRRCHSFVDLSCCSDSRAEQGARRAGINILTAQWSDLVKSAQETASFAVLFLQGMRSFDGLDAPDKLRFSAFFTRYTRNFEGMFIYYRDGALEKALLERVERTMSDYSPTRSKTMVGDTKHWLTDEFRAVVEAIIAKNPEPKMYATTT
jgi:hypothetical protein